MKIDRMKRMMFGLLAAVLLAACESEETPLPDDGKGETEVALYDSTMTAVAYIDCADADSTLYLWDGRPVAYLVDREDVYQYNGHFLGWYRDGMLFGRDGRVAGAVNAVRFGEINTMVTHVPAAKGVKGVKPVPHVRSVKPARPLFEGKWSRVDLTTWLLDAEADSDGDRS